MIVEVFMLLFTRLDFTSNPLFLRIRKPSALRL